MNRKVYFVMTSVFALATLLQNKTFQSVPVRIGKLSRVKTIFSLYSNEQGK